MSSSGSGSSSGAKASASASASASGNSFVARKRGNGRVAMVVGGVALCAFAFPWWYVQYRKKQREESYTRPLPGKSKQRQAALNRGMEVSGEELRQMLQDDPKLFATMQNGMVDRRLVREVTEWHQQRGTWELAGVPEPTPEQRAAFASKAGRVVPIPFAHATAPTDTAAAAAAAGAAGAAAATPAAAVAKPRGPTLTNIVSTWDMGYTATNNPAAAATAAAAAPGNNSTAAQS